MGIETMDDFQNDLNLSTSTRHTSPHDEIILSPENIYHWHKTEPVKDVSEAKNYMRALLTLCKSQVQTKSGIKISLLDAIRGPLLLEVSLDKRYRVTTWMKKTLESWLVVFEATGEDAYEATRSAHFNYESDFAQKLERRTKSDKTWNYVKSVREKGFRKFKRTDFPGYEFVEEMNDITESMRRETHIDIGNKLPRDQAQLLLALIGLYFPKRNNAEHKRRWKNYTAEDVISRISEDFKYCSGINITENMVKKYANLKN